MEWLILGAAALAALVAMIIATRGAERPTRGSGSVGSGMFGAVDEVFSPARHEARLEQERQTSLSIPVPSADDDDRGVYRGRISIRLDDR
ncbi:MAG: hypothetical protein ABWZ77_04425 [Naasia sp.]